MKEILDCQTLDKGVALSCCRKIEFAFLRHGILLCRNNNVLQKLPFIKALEVQSAKNQ